MADDVNRDADGKTGADDGAGVCPVNHGGSGRGDVNDDRPVQDWATDFNLWDMGYTADPVPVWQDLQQNCPMAHTDRWGGMFMATRYDDLLELTAMTDVLSNRQPTVRKDMNLDGMLDDRHLNVNPPISSDPPEHRDLRRLILPFFTLKSVAGYRPFTEKTCNDLIDRFIDRGQADAAADYAQQLTPLVIGHMLGIDPDRSDEFIGWTRDFIEFGQEDQVIRASSYRKMTLFFHEMIAERRARPGADDYISVLLRAELDGKPVPEETLVNLCVLLLIAGIDTTWSALGSSLLHFATHTDHRRQLAADPGLMSSAVEEMLRVYAPVTMSRIAMEDFEFRGKQIRRGDRVLMNFAAANHDVDAFDDVDDIRLDRQKNRHAAFGLGIHRCAGSNLARMEMEVALSTWFRRIPEFELTDPDAVTWAPGQVRGARTVPVRWQAG